MPSDTTILHFVLMENSAGMLFGTPATPELRSLNSVSRWIKRQESHLHACAFFTIEVLNDYYTSQARNISQAFQNDFPGLFAQSLKKPAIALTEKLIENPESDHGTETEEFEFHIYALPNGVPSVSKPGTYVEISHGRNIDDNTAWWDGQLPGIIFGHISIEIYKEMLLPEAAALVEKHYHGSPEDLEALVEDDIKSLFRYITGH